MTGASAPPAPAWTWASERPAAGTIRARLLHEGEAVSYGAVIDGWGDGGDLADVFTRLFAAAPFAAFLWETPPVTAATLGARAFECVLVDEPALTAMAPDEETFRAHFTATGPDAAAAVFANLGGDALLVAPRPRSEAGPYPHLAAFARGAPRHQQRGFWQAVAGAVQARLSDEPVWISTNGLGVAWLHVRIDTCPKYCSFAPYRRRP